MLAACQAPDPNTVKQVWAVRPTGWSSSCLYPMAKVLPPLRRDSTGRRGFQDRLPQRHVRLELLEAAACVLWWHHACIRSLLDGAWHRSRLRHRPGSAHTRGGASDSYKLFRGLLPNSCQPQVLQKWILNLLPTEASMSSKDLREKLKNKLQSLLARESGGDGTAKKLGVLLVGCQDLSFLVFYTNQNKFSKSLTVKRSSDISQGRSLQAYCMRKSRGWQMRTWWRPRIAEQEAIC